MTFDKGIPHGRAVTISPEGVLFDQNWELGKPVGVPKPMVFDNSKDEWDKHISEVLEDY